MSSNDDHSGEHAGGIRNQMRLVVRVLGALSVLSGLMYLMMPSAGGILLAGCAAGWVVTGIYYQIYTRVIDPAGDAIGRILMPSGNSTPSAKGLSHIEAMVARGDYRKAADAYRTEIETDPADVRSCEALGQLAMRELKDFPLALFAFREAEKRAVQPGRKLTYGMVVAELLRDHLREPGKAAVELRRLLASYPNAPNAAALRNELELLKSHLFENP